MARMLGIGKGGVKLSNLMIVGSALGGLFVKTYNGWSAAGAAFAKGVPWSMQDRAFIAANAYAHALTGLKFDPEGSYSNSAYAGMGVAAGVGAKIAGRFVNPMLSGSPIKL